MMTVATAFGDGTARRKEEAPTPSLLSSANHRDSSGLARSLALSFSRVAAARRIPVLPDVLQRNSGFLARARHARGNDRKIRPSGRGCHYLVQDSIELPSRRSTLWSHQKQRSVRFL